MMIHPLAPFESAREQTPSPLPLGEAGDSDSSESRVRAIGQLLASGRSQLHDAGADSPWLTALVLLEHATGLDRSTLLARPEAEPTTEQNASFHHLLQRRCAREPLAYVLGYRDFYGRRFAVSAATLIPRPETEGLVALALGRLDSLSTSQATLLDVGTGSGAIVVSVLAERPGIRAIATDCSRSALAVARHNARTYGASRRLWLVACDLASGVRERFPLVVANLPYVPSDEIDALELEVASYEPRGALDGGPDGTAVIRRFLSSLAAVLAPGGVALLEFGDGQAVALDRYATELLPGFGVAVRRDDAGAERFLVVERPER